MKTIQTILFFLLCIGVYSQTPKAYITNFGDNFISVVDIDQKLEESQFDPEVNQSHNYGKSADTKYYKNPMGRVTKKSVCLEFISRAGGGSINEMAKAIVDRGIDPDYEKNIRVCRLWMSKIGVPVIKLQNGNYVKSVHL